LTQEDYPSLGLCEPSPVRYGLVNSRYANSDWWFRNYSLEAARCEPFF